MKFIKKNKNIIIVLLVFAAILAAILIFKDTVMFEENEAIYGNRTDGAEEVKITEDQEKQISEALKELTESVSIRTAGRIVNVSIEVNPGTELHTAKELSTTVLNLATEEQKKFYDFQFLITESENLDQYPIIGYKQKTRDTVTWTQDRAKTES